MAARWARAGASTASSAGRRRRSSGTARRPIVRSELPHRRRRSSSRTSQRYTALAGRRDRRRRDRRHPGRARRPRPRRHRARDRARARGAATGSARGPHETYPDRKRGGLVGRWASTVTDQYVPYIRPQENGGHADVRWLELARRRPGRGLRIDLDGPRQVSVTHHRAADLAAATHDVDLVAASPRRSSTSTPPTAASGTASCGPDTLPEYLVGARHVPLGAGPCATSRAPDRADRLGAGDARSSTSATSGSATSCGSTTTARSATCISARPWRPAGRTRHLGPAASPASRTGSATRSRSSTRRPGSGDYRVPALAVEHADGSTVLDLAYATTGSSPASRPAATRPARRPTSRTTTRPTRSRSPRRRAERPRRRPRLHDLPRPPGDRPERPDPQRRGRPRSASTGAMSASLDLPDARWELVQLSGAWARETPRRRAPAPARPPVGRQRPGRRPATSTTRSSRCAAPTTTEDARRGLRLQPRLLGQLPRRGRGRAVRDDPGPDRHQPGHVRLDPRAGRRVRRRPEAVLVYSDAGLGGDERRASTASTASGSPAAPGATGRGRSSSTTGRATYFDFDEDEARRDRDVRPRPRRRAVRPRRRLVRPARRRHDRRSATGSSTGASCPNGLDGLAGRDRGARHELRAVDRARDGQRAERAVRGAPGLGDRRPRPAADREPPAARPRHVARRRSSTTSFDVLSEVLASAPDLVRQVGHEPEHHRAVQRRACRPTARASSSTATSSASTTCTPG